MAIASCEEKAEESLAWWKDTFGSDFYLEIQRHNQENEDYSSFL